MKYYQGVVSVRDVKLHYYRTGGNKPPFVLLHGATDNGLCWTRLAEALAETYDVIMPDAQGHGLSDRLTPGFKTMDLADQTAGLVRELNLAPPIVMGHSMGAGTAVNFAAEYPDIPRAIILEDPGWNTHESFQSLSEEQKKKQREGFAAFLTGFGKRNREEIEAECRRANPTWAESEFGPWAESKLQFDFSLFTKLQIDRPPYTEQVPKIKCPLLLLISDSGVVSVKTAKQAEGLWKSTRPFRWVLIKGAGHNIRREQFEQVREAVLSFCRDLG